MQLYTSNWIEVEFDYDINTRWEFEYIELLCEFFFFFVL